MMKISAVVACAVLTVLLATGCSHKRPAAGRAPIEVKTTTVGSGNDRISDEYVGTVEEKTGTILSFEVPGNVTSLTVKEGDVVRRGQRIGTIRPNTLQDAHQATLTALKQAQDAYKRMKPLHQQGVISEIQWVDVESKLQQAEAAERMAREQLVHTVLTAPAGGVIAARYADPGMNVMGGQQIYRLVDVSKVEIKVSVPEDEIYHISKGMAASIRVKAADNATFCGRVTEKGIAANSLSHTYDVKIEVDNTARRLMPGMVCSATFQATGGQNPEQVVIPQGCVELDTDGKRFVWTVEAGKARMRPVTIGGFTGQDGVEVTDGLHPGDKVITSGMQKVSDGMKVSER